MAVVHELKVVGAKSDVWAIEVGVFQLSAVSLVWEVCAASFLGEKHISRRYLIQELGMSRSPMECF